MKKKVLVTGGCGYIGSVLVKELLKSGYQVCVADRLDYGGDSVGAFIGDPDFRIEVGDLSDSLFRSKILAGIDYVIHLAATVGIGPCSKNQEESYLNNCKNTQKLASEAKKRGVKKFIFASTCSNYSSCTREQICNENTYVEAYDPYSRSKIDAEKYLLALNSNDFNVIIFRLATVYGISGRTRYCLLINHFTKQAYIDKKLEIYNGNFSRPYVHILDVCYGFLLALSETTSKVSGEIFNLGSNDANCSKIEIVNKIKKYIPDVCVNFEEDLTVQDLRDYVVDFTKIHRLLGFTPTKSIDDGIKDVLYVVKNNILKDRKELYNY